MESSCRYCRDCKSETVAEVDHTSGDTICTACGLVLDHHYVDETSEWRTFSDSENYGRDPNRVGGLSNPLLTAGNLSTTIIVKPTRGGGCSKSDDMNQLAPTNSKSKAYDLMMNPDRVLTKGFESIAAMADRLGIVKATKIRADEIFKNAVEKRPWKGKALNSIMAASLFIACKENKYSQRTMKEICSVAEGVSRKAINRAVELVNKEVQVQQLKGSLNGSGMARRFCSNLGMKNQDMKAVEEALDNLQEVDVRRSPVSILAATIFIITQLSNQNTPLQDIAMAAQVAEQTIKKSYKDIYPHACKIIPRWYAKEDDLTKLCKP